MPSVSTYFYLVYLCLPFSTYFYLCLHMSPHFCLCLLCLLISTYVHTFLPMPFLCLPISTSSTYVSLFSLISTFLYILCLPISTYSLLCLYTYFYLCSPMSSFVYLCLHISTYVYLFLPLSTYVYLFQALSPVVCLFIPLPHNYISVFLPMYPHFSLRLSISTGLGHSPGHIPRTFTPGENANNVVEIEAGMIKQYFSSISSRCWIDETIGC